MSKEGPFGEPMFGLEKLWLKGPMLMNTGGSGPVNLLVSEQSTEITRRQISAWKRKTS